MPASLRFDRGSCSRASEKSTLHTGIVKARIALRPAGSCWTPNSSSPFQPAMLNSASRATLTHSGRGMRIEAPDIAATASKPSPAKGSVKARNVSGAISLTPIFSTGQLQPQTRASTATGNSAAAVMCGVGDASARVNPAPLATAARRICSGAARAPA